MAEDTPTRKAVRQTFPDLTFWYGLTPRDIMSIPRWLLMEYLENLDRLKAEQEVMMTRAMSFPNLKKSAQNEARRDLKKRLEFGRERQAIRPKTKGEMMSHTSGVGIGFVTE